MVTQGEIERVAWVRGPLQASKPAPEPKVRLERGPERWLRWQRWLDDGVYASRAEMARAEGVSRAAVTQGLRALSPVR